MNRILHTHDVGTKVLSFEANIARDDLPSMIEECHRIFKLDSIESQQDGKAIVRFVPEKGIKELV